MTQPVTQQVPDIDLADCSQHTPVEDELFNDTIRKLRGLQHQIDDLAEVAASKINALRNTYNYILESNRPFLQTYAMEHLRRDKDGEIKGKSYRTLDSGGGVFFRAQPEKITFSQIVLKDFYEEQGLQGIVKTITYTAQESSELLKQLNWTDDTIKQAGIKIQPAMPFAKMSIGGNKAWSVTKAKQLLFKALTGEAPLDIDEEE